VDRVFAGKGVLYFSRLTSKAAQSHLNRVVAKPAYQSMTIRNWNTTSKLFEMMARIRVDRYVSAAGSGESPGGARRR
jgi:uncharacterized protein (DUF1697 family)